MKKNKSPKGILTISILVLLLFSCSSRQTKKTISWDREIADSVVLSRIDSIYTYPQRIRELFSKTQQQLKDSIAYYKLELFIGFCLYYEGDFQSIRPIHRRVQDFCKRTLGTEALEAICWNHHAMIQQFENNMDSTLICLHHAYNVLQRSDDHGELTSVCINIADMYNLSGNLPKAATFYLKALAVTDSLHSPREHFSIYTGLAQTYTYLNNFQQADRYFQLAEASIESALAQEQVFFYHNKGTSFYLRKEYSESLKYFQKAYLISNKFKYDYYNISIEINMGELYTLLNQPDSAHYYLDKANLSLSKTPNANQDQIFYLNSLYAGLALEENDLAAANRYLSKPYTTVRATSIHLHNKRLMDYYARKRDFEKAYHYREIVNQYDDSLRNARNVANITEIDYRYSQDTTLLKRNIIIANNETLLSRQKGIITLSIALLIISILLAFTVILHIRRKNERKYNRQLSMVAELRMENIRNRISPHYVFNVLNAIMPTFKQYSELSHPLQLLIDVLRGNLLASDKIATELGEEIELVRKYIALRKESNPHTTNVIWEIDEHTSMQTLIPSMIIQIPVENALKYAFDAIYDSSNRISIRISPSANGLFIHIEDNGNGYHPGEYPDTKRGTGTGLKVLFRTIELLNSKNPQKASFTIRNIIPETADAHGTIVDIYIPFNYQFKF